MKARKFFKKLISVRWILIILLVLGIGIVTTVYFTVGIKAHTITIDNMDFSLEGFEDFADKSESELKHDVIVGKNDKFIMFMDEETTIVTVAVRSTLKSGMTGNKASDYGTVYRSANSDGIDAKKSNFELGYAGTNVAKPINNTLDSYSKSVKFVNALTEHVERHYQIKYLNKATHGYDGAQILYTIGNFGSLSTFFPEKYFATVYKPAKVLFTEYKKDGTVKFDEAAYNNAVKEWEEGYLVEVGGKLSNTFEERYRGNIEIGVGYSKPKGDNKAYLKYSNEISVYDEAALDYLLETVFPKLAADGYDVPEVTKEELDEKSTVDTFGNARWVIKEVPLELLKYDSPYYNEFFNNENSPLTNNPFISSPTFAQTIKGSYRPIYADGKSVMYPYYLSTIKTGSATSIYKALYSDEQTIVNDGMIKKPLYYIGYDGEEIPFASTGYVARDEEGNFVRDEEGNLVKQLYTYDQVIKDNDLFKVTTEGLPTFRLALEFKLTDLGLVITVPHNSVVDSSNLKEDDPDYKLLNVPYIITSIKVCPNLTNVDDTQEGYMVIPDGSGAIINFNNGKTSTISANYYGKDLAYVEGVKTEDPARLLLGMYAFVNTTPANPGGLLAIIEKGGGQVSLTAGVSDNFHENYAYLKAELRGKETVKTGTVSAEKEYDKWDKILAPSDIRINYQILGEDELTYPQIAKKYQKYLMDRDGLYTELPNGEREYIFNDTTNKLINDLTFLGTFERYDLFLGIKYKKSDTLTTFKQAMEIINELGDNQVNDLSVSYRGWTNEYLEYELGGSLKVAGKLGHTAGIRSFYKFCVEKQIPFFPELSIASAKGYDYLLGSTKYSARGVGNEEAIHYSFDLATLRPDKKLSKTYMLAPQFYHAAASKVMKDFNRLKVWDVKEDHLGGFYLTDLGNQWTGNYKKGQQVYGNEALTYQLDALDIISQNGKIKISAPCDYAFKYVDTAVNVPVSSAMYTIYDAQIPFYQLTVNGLFDYTTEQINGLSNRSSDWYFAKALESGSNISYLLSYEDPAVLLDTDYTQYYQAYYQNWKKFIINKTKIINDLGIHDCYLTDHEFVDGLSKVTYTNKHDSSKTITLIINCSEKAYNGYGPENKDIPAYGFIQEN